MYIHVQNNEKKINHETNKTKNRFVIVIVDHILLTGGNCCMPGGGGGGAIPGGGIMPVLKQDTDIIVRYTRKKNRYAD